MRLLIRLQRGREWVNEVDKSIIGIWCYGELCCMCILFYFNITWAISHPSSEQISSPIIHLLGPPTDEK